MKKEKIVVALLASVLGVQVSLTMAAGVGSISNPYIGGYDNYIDVNDQSFIMTGDVNCSSTYNYDIDASSEWMGATVSVRCETYTKLNIEGTGMETVVAQTFEEEEENKSKIDESIFGYLLEYAKFTHSVVGVYDDFFYATDY